MNEEVIIDIKQEKNSTSYKWKYKKYELIIELLIICLIIRFMMI